MKVPTWTRTCLARLLLSAWLLTTSATLHKASHDSYIEPSSKVPDFNPAAWNRAFKLTLRNIPAEYSSGEVLQSLSFPNTMLSSIQVAHECSVSGFDVIPASDVALGSCFSRPGLAGTRDYWVKLPGLALVNGNCYCYALDLFQGGYCYPGASSGAINSYRQCMTCKSLIAAATSDGAQLVPRQEALSGQPGSGHYIALMARPESCIKGHCYEADFHAMRKDSSGAWSWKHPGMPATNRDLFGALVTDPEAAALLGSYQVCSYLHVQPTMMLHVDAGSRKELGPLPVNPALDKYRALPGVQVEISAVPYNPATDCALSTLSQQAIAEDTAWEKLRGTEQYLAWRVREKQALELLPRGVNEADRGGSSSNNTGGSRDVGAVSSRALRRHRSRQLLQAR